MERCRTPFLVQRWLRSLPYNHELGGETLRSFRGVVRHGLAHCLEAALSAAAILERHGRPPLLLDLESQDELDHVLFLFKGDRGWGAVGRSRDPGLHGRRPVFASVRELALSFVDPFVDRSGRLTGYGVLDLRTLRGVDWRFSDRNVWAVERALIRMPHRPLRSSERRHQRWLDRFLRYKRRFPDRKPVYYPGRRLWM